MIPSKHMDDQKILQSDWTIAFCETEFSYIWGLYKKIENPKIFHI